MKKSLFSKNSFKLQYSAIFPQLISPHLLLPDQLSHILLLKQKVFFPLPLLEISNCLIWNPLRILQLKTSHLSLQSLLLLDILHLLMVKLPSCTAQVFSLLDLDTLLVHQLSFLVLRLFLLQLAHHPVLPFKHPLFALLPTVSRLR